MSIKVRIILGSSSDVECIAPAVDILKMFHVEHDLYISSAHRNPENTMRLASSAESEGIQVLIAAAGLAAHLPGIIAANTCLPVIGVPLASGALNGIDSLLSIVQMPAGVPVACVAIGGAKNAALLAIQILSCADSELRERFREYKESLKD